MSQTPNVTYVTLDKDSKEPKHISVYKNRIKQYDIDLTFPHNKEMVLWQNWNKRGICMIKYKIGFMIFSRVEI